MAPVIGTWLGLAKKLPPCGSINFFSCVLLVSLLFFFFFFFPQVFRIVEMLMRHFAYISMPSSLWPVVALARVPSGCVGNAQFLRQVPLYFMNNQSGGKTLYYTINEL